MSKHTREKFVSPSAQPAKPVEVPPGAAWNGIRRLWMVDGVACDPQPAAPLRSGTVGVLPSVKVEV